MQKVRDLLDLCKSLKMTSCLKVCIYFLIVKKKQLRPDFYKDVMKNNDKKIKQSKTTPPPKQ